MKILEYLHTSAGGHWRYVTELALALSQQSETVIVTSDRPMHGLEGLRCASPLSCIDTSARGARRIINRMRVYRRQTLQLADFLAEEYSNGQTNVVHFQQLPTLRALKSVVVARTRAYMVAITVHNVAPHSDSLVDRLKHRDAIRAWAAADVLLVHSDRLRDELTSLVPTAIIRVIPHPIWPDRPRGNETAERDYLFFGVLRENKGIHRFIEALALLGNPTASIVGSGSPETIRGIQNALALRSLTRCEFIPGYYPDEEVAGLFDRHAVLVAPYTHFEAQSGVTHLALAHRRPMVVTDAGGLGDPVREFGVGEVVTPDPQSLADGMIRVLDRARISGSYNSGFDSAAESLAIETIAGRTVECFAEIVKALRPDL